MYRHWSPAKTLVALPLVVPCVLSLSACSEWDSKGTISVGYLPSWSEGLVTAHLLEQQFESQGYEVEHEIFDDLDSLYSALAEGEVNLYPSAWPDRTQETYMDHYSESVVSLGAFYDDARLFLAVPTYSSITSIEELADSPQSFGGEIVGIEPDAGLTATTEAVIDEYGLDVPLAVGSTPLMLSKLQTAIADEREIVVTMWSPFWAASSSNVRALDDPLGAMGGPESLHFLGTRTFDDDYPEVSGWLGQVMLSEQEYLDLEQAVVFEANTGEERESVRGWVRDNPTALPDWG